MNQISQDSISTEFKLTVLPNSNPKAEAEFISQDQETYVNQWFSHTLSIQLFKDIETNRNLSIAIQGSYGKNLPNWVNFNSDNRSIYGFPK